MNSITCHPIDDCVRAILLDLSVRIENSAVNILTGSNPEDIHGLRVATRRTRTALSEIPGVFEKKSVKPFKSDFKRIGAVTGKCRDLDVWLEVLAEDLRSTNPSHTLESDPLGGLITRQRDTARNHASVEISKPWFRTLLKDWVFFLENPQHLIQKPTAADRSIAMVASTRILKAHSRLLKKGLALPPQPSAAQFHRLRIDGKKLRYLLEFFGAHFGQDRSQEMIGRLKLLQDALGGINDREIQLEALESLGIPRNSADPSLPFAIERHRLHLTQSREIFRLSFVDQFQHFSDVSTIRSFRSLFGNADC